VCLGESSLCIVFDGWENSICFVGVCGVGELVDSISSALHDFFRIKMEIVKFFTEMHFKEMFAGCFW